VKHPVRLLAVAGSLVALAVAGLAANSQASMAGNPFYLIPTAPRLECHNVHNCLSVIGPWVVVPASGEASFLLTCPKGKLSGFVGGTDTRASSTNVRVWFDGQIGAPIGQSITTGHFLFFHGVTTNGKQGSFEPVIGCTTLQSQTNARSTVSARRAAALPGTRAGSPLDLHAKILELVSGSILTKIARCLPHEKLVGSWTALAFASTGLPSLAHVNAVTIKSAVARNAVSAVVSTDRSLPFAPLAEVQVGVECTM
jgi:hypothetical protein